MQKSSLNPWIHRYLTAGLDNRPSDSAPVGDRVSLDQVDVRWHDALKQYRSSSSLHRLSSPQERTRAAVFSRIPVPRRPSWYRRRHWPHFSMFGSVFTIHPNANQTLARVTASTSIPTSPTCSNASTTTSTQPSTPRSRTMARTYGMAGRSRRNPATATITP